MKKDIYILAIETSCDDTSIAILKNENVIGNACSSTTKLYKKYGGIIPEYAARGHADAINDVLNEALKVANISLTDINYITYTYCPGLPGSLHVGKVFAKTLAVVCKKPLIKIDHMMGHAYSANINKKEISFPFLSLVVSGGNTILYQIDSVKKYKIINQTNDDPVGEMLDKVGKFLNMGYPGGISLDKNYDETKYIESVIHHQLPNKQFSFSGIKSWARNEVNKKKYSNIEIGSTVLKWTIDELKLKIEYYCKVNNIKHVLIGGGVCANSLLRKEFSNYSLTEIKYCGDNAMMIGYYAYLLITKPKN